MYTIDFRLRWITEKVALGFRAGFSFSAGATDLLFSSTLPAAQKTLLIIPLGIAAFVVFYFVFLFAIKKFDLKTPGREDDDLEEEKNVQLASDDYTEIAKKILAGCGGKGNIVSIDNCVTRLRLEVRDMTAVNDKAIKAAGVAGVIKPGKTSVQVIVGTKVHILAVCMPVQPVKQEQQHCHIKDKKRKKLQTPEKGDTSHKAHQQGRIPNRGETAAYVGNQKNKKHNNVAFPFSP